MSIIYPYPSPALDKTEIDTAIKQLKDNEKIDDDAVAALETLLKAKDVALDKAIADLKTKVDAIPAPSQDSPVTTLFDPLTTPVPSQVLSGAGATATPATTGSLLVNQGKTHTTSRTTTPPLIAWESTMIISPVMGECRVRWAVLSVRQATLEIQLGTAPAIQALNTGLGWTCVDPTLTIWTDGNYTCFDKVIPAQASPLSVRFQFPTGPSVVQLPSLYPTSTPFSLIPADPTAIKLTDLKNLRDMTYRPSEFLKKTDLPVPLYGPPVTTKAELSLIQGRSMELRGCQEDNRVYLWRSPTVDRLQKTWASSIGRGAFPVSAIYPQRVGSGWLPIDITYVQNPAWQATGNLNADGTPIYACKLTTGSITSISYDFSDPADINVFGSVSYDATAIASWTDSGYWGGRTLFGSVVLSNGRTVKPITCIRDDGSLLLSSMNVAGTVTGSVRNVRVNGIAVDVLALPEQVGSLSDRIGVLERTPASLVSYRTETLLDTTPSLTSETYLKISGVPAGSYLAFFRLTMNLTTIGSRHWCLGVGINDAAVNHPTNTHAVVSVTSDAYTVNYPQVANGSTPISLPNTTNTVEVKGQLYGTDHLTGESISHGYLTLIKL